MKKFHIVVIIIIIVVSGVTCAALIANNKLKDKTDVPPVIEATQESDTIQNPDIDNSDITSESEILTGYDGHENIESEVNTHSGLVLEDAYMYIENADEVASLCFDYYTEHGYDTDTSLVVDNMDDKYLYLYDLFNHYELLYDLENNNILEK